MSIPAGVGMPGLSACLEWPKLSQKDRSWWRQPMSPASLTLAMLPLFTGECLPACCCRVWVHVCSRHYILTTESLGGTFQNQPKGHACLKVVAIVGTWCCHELKACKAGIASRSCQRLPRGVLRNGCKHVCRRGCVSVSVGDQW